MAHSSETEDRAVGHRARNPEPPNRERSLAAGDDPLLTVQEVAQVLQVPVSWVYEHARRGKRQRRLPAIKIGKYLRFAASDVQAYVAEARASRR